MLKKKKKIFSISFIIIILFLLLVLLRYCSEQEIQQYDSQIVKNENKIKKQVLVDSVKIKSDTLNKDTLYKDSLAEVKKNKKINKDSSTFIKKAKNRKPKKLKKELSKEDSLINKKDTLSVKSKVLVLDTIPPYVYADPPGGLFDSEIKVYLKSLEKNTTIMFSLNNKEYKEYKTPLTLKEETLLKFFGIDTAGNISDTITFMYKFDFNNPCPKGMVYVKDRKLCIDKYEFPNKRGIKPVNFISYYAALDSCVSRGKELCSFEDLQAAAGNSKYVYGNNYDPRKCNTESGTIYPSGSFLECRSYFGAYDLNGNLAEWTSTKSKEDKSKQIVFGGSYASKSLATNYSGVFSYFPENSYVNVGFRCCLKIK